METNKLLINEYKVNNDTLTGLVAKNKGYAKENEQLKDIMANERSSHQLQIADLGHQIDERDLLSKNLNIEQQTDRLIEVHKTALERFEERKGYRTWKSSVSP